MATVQAASFDLETMQFQAKTGLLPTNSSSAIHKNVTPKFTRVKKSDDVKEKAAVDCRSSDTVINDFQSKDINNMPKVSSKDKEKAAVVCQSPDTVINDFQSKDINNMPEVSSKENLVKCWACEFTHNKCETCVFNDAKSGKDVDKTSLAEAIHVHEQILGAYNMALIQKNVDTATEFRKILMVV